ncbi:MAG TPA: hypothetical protein VGF17_01870 [Phytomonospora sp.]
MEIDHAAKGPAPHDVVVVTGTGRGPSRPDQIAAAEELVHLRDRCVRALADNGSFDVAEIRRTAAALRARATADDVDAAYGFSREGTTVRMTLHSGRWEAFKILNRRLVDRYRQRSLAGWIVGLVIALLCHPAREQAGGLTADESEWYRAVDGTASVIALVAGVGFLIGLISASRRNKARRRAHFHEYEHLVAEFQYAEEYLRERSAGIGRAGTEASVVHDNLTAVLNRAEASSER